MAFIRVIVLLFLAWLGWMFGHIENPNGFGNFMGATFFITGPALYLLPTYEAVSNDHPNTTSIVILNILLGWTLLGWIVALLWAINKPQAQQVSTQEIKETKACQMCAETILAAAIKCKHCGADLQLPI